jgi:hypothetical protein
MLLRLADRASPPVKRAVESGMGTLREAQQPEGQGHKQSSAPSYPTELESESSHIVLVRLAGTHAICGNICGAEADDAGFYQEKSMR